MFKIQPQVGNGVGGFSGFGLFHVLPQLCIFHAGACQVRQVAPIHQRRQNVVCQFRPALPLAKALPCTCHSIALVVRQFDDLAAVCYIGIYSGFAHGGVSIVNPPLNAPLGQHQAIARHRGHYYKFLVAPAIPQAVGAVQNRFGPAQRAAQFVIFPVCDVFHHFHVSDLHTAVSRAAPCVAGRCVFPRQIFRQKTPATCAAP